MYRHFEPQLRLAKDRGKTFDRARQLLGRVDELVGAHEPIPSLLHGDLWGGNASFDPAGAPVIFDPAVYFGDREAELAFTRMFGGFSETRVAVLPVAADPLVPGFGGNRELLAQLADGEVPTLSEAHKLLSQFHRHFSFPGHFALT